MEVKKSETTKATFGEATRTSVYACSWNNTVQIELGDHDSNGICHEFELTLPVAVARKLAEELVEDIRQFDEKKAKEAAEQTAEEAAEEAERIADECEMDM